MSEKKRVTVTVTVFETSLVVFGNLLKWGGKWDSGRESIGLKNGYHNLSRSRCE